ncbi:MAG: leucine-rich repeat protein [Ruminococcus sp.]|nr:leucine-rich repeat protein [Ruminococcus sp.]
MKKILSLIISLIIIATVCVVPVSAAPTADELGGFLQNGMTKNTATTKDGIVYKLKDDGTAAVCGAKEGLTELVIPSVVDGYKVSEVTTHAQRFSGSGTVEKLTISEGVECLSDFLSCFYNATEINLPSSIKEIRNMSFLSNMAYYKDERNWENGCLYIGTNLVSVNADAPEVLEIREDTTCIANFLYIPLTASVKEIILPTYEVFGLRNLIPYLSLERVTVPAEFKEIPAGLFSQCEKLTDVTIEEGITKIGDRAFFECDSLTEIEIPSTVKTIGVRAFGMCNGFTEFKIPDTVKKIEKQAFAGCENLIVVDIPASVTEIGVEALGFGGHYYSESSDHGLGYYETKNFTVCAPEGSKGMEYANNNEFNYFESWSDYIKDLNGVDFDNPRDFDTFVFGDADLDGKLSIKDATYIQKVSAHFFELEYKVQHFVSTVNLDFDINVKDATLIQKHLANFDTGYPIGQTFTWEELFDMF